jgi:glucose/arabinose dehydrogenase
MFVIFLAMSNQNQNIRQCRAKRRFVSPYIFFIVILAIAGIIVGAKSGNKPNDLQLIQLPDGFKIEMYMEGVKEARSMALGDRGTLFVGSRREGKVYAIPDNDHDYKGDKVITIASGLTMPNGVEFRDGNLYVAEVSRVWMLEDIENRLYSVPEPKIIRDDYPTETHHGWKYIKFGPDGLLYVPVGAPCNICNEENDIYASMTRLNVETGERQIFAQGVRNSVGFAWHPETNELWFTDNGRDMMGDDLPNDELNRAYQKGLHFGYPFCHAGFISDPEFGYLHDCSEFEPPVQKLGPHVASLGMIFYTGKMFPKEYKNKVLIAEHGSWNRSTLIGYRITAVTLKDNIESIDYSVFADGWLQGIKKLGRPVDLLQLDDGSVLVSDDFSGRIYRITYEP